MQVPFFHVLLNTAVPPPESVDFTVRQEDGYYVVGRPDGPIWLRLRIRPEYPGTYCRQQSASIIVLGYGPAEPQQDDEFLQVRVTKSGDITVVRDAFATLPVWFGHQADVVSISDSHAVVYRDLPGPRLSRTGILNTLQPNLAHMTTIWEEIRQLGERHTLTVRHGELKIREPAANAWQHHLPATRSDHRVFSRRFSQHLDAFTATRLAGQNVAFEVSGGLDSSLLPLYLARFGRKMGSNMGSLIFPGLFRGTQTAKLDTIAELTGLRRNDIELDTLEHYPLAHVFQQDYPRPFYPLEDIYMTPLRRLVGDLAQQGARVIATGHGGDELFENIMSPEDGMRYGEAERQHRLTTRYAPFHTEQFRQDYVQAASTDAPYPVPLLSTNVLSGSLSTNNLYIEQGVWPVSPFIDPALYKFCQGLPAHFRADRQILRAFYKAYGLPEAIYNPTQREHFGGFFASALASGKYDDVIRYFADNSVAVQLGYVDKQRLLATFEESRETPDAGEDHLLYIYFWLCFEVNAQPI